MNHSPKPALRKYLKLAAALAFVGVIVVGCWPGNGNWFSRIDVQVPNSAIVSHENAPSLTGDEEFIVLQLSPAQLRALLTQFKTKRDFAMGPTRKTSSSAWPTEQQRNFFSSVPPRAQSGGFRFDHVKTSPSWPTFCSFSVDKSTGRIWFYAWSVYN